MPLITGILCLIFLTGIAALAGALAGLLLAGALMLAGVVDFANLHWVIKISAAAFALWGAWQTLSGDPAPQNYLHARRSRSGALWHESDDDRHLSDALGPFDAGMSGDGLLDPSNGCFGGNWD